MITLAPLTGASGWGENHVAREAAGTKKQRDQLRAALRDQGCTLEQIAAEMARCFGFRARQAWRHTHGWTQDDVATAYNRLLNHDHAPMTGKRISDFETWPHGGVRPTTTTLAMLAVLYSTTPTHLVDLDDRRALSTQELIALDTPTPPLPAAAAAPRLPDSPHPDNNATHATTTGDHPLPPAPNTSTTTDQPGHTPDRPEDTTHRLTVRTTPPSPRPRRRLILACLLAIVIAAIGEEIIARTPAPHPQPRPAHPSTSSLPTASGPSSTSPPAAPLPTSQTAPSAHQSLVPFSPPPQAPPAPPRLSLPLFPPAPKTPQPSPPAARPESLPPPSGPPTAHTDTASTTARTWENMYYGLCLDEVEADATGDPGTLRLWDCNGSTNQMWTENDIADHRSSLAKNLVSVRSGQCVTYQPDPRYGIVTVWLAPCGQDGQAWIRGWNGNAYDFHAAELPGVCMAVTNGPLAGGFPEIRLGYCHPHAPPTDWLPSTH